ncbi:MAG: hypothetical protein VKL23_09285 [Cyanobacteriota bacterium]|jgi:hypothetical protein|nr:hypothetical protein [Cyanobacteriota bacterium]
MRTLVKTLASTLVLEDPAERPEPAPAVYTTAICSGADLPTALSGIALLSRNLGYTLHPETLYAADGCSASYHADHAEVPVGLVVDCNPRRGTVALAVSGMDPAETLECFTALERTLFGDC